ncbi:MAG: hypothetical protein AAF985_09565 [Bacteroidota bacterium]
MDNLRELVYIVSKQKVKKIEIIGNPGNKNSKMNELYEAIHNGEVSTDEEAAQLIYDTNANDVNYKKLKYRLQNRLINTIFFIDTSKPSFNEYTRAFYSTHKAQLAIAILLGRNARKPAIDLAQRTLRVAMKYEFSEITLELCKRLRRHYGAMEGNIKKFNEYNELTKKYSKLVQAELIADEYCQRLTLPFAKSKANADDELKQLAIQFEKELLKYTDEMHSFNLNLYAYTVYVLRYELFRDFKNMLLVCEKAIEYMESRPFKNRKSFHFLYRKLICHIQLRQFEEGEATAEKCLEMYSMRFEGSYNWFIIIELYMILSFYAKNYQKTIELLQIAKPKLKSSTTHPRIKEKWKIYEAFTHYFIKIGKVKPDPSFEKNIKRFRISKFLNDVPTFSSDKRGLNITILIIQVLFLLHRKDYDVVIDKVEALDAYCYRYLRKDETFRSNCFIKMLLELPKTGFNKQRVIRRSEKYLKKLQSADAERTANTILVEIVPYEDLWGDILNSLENKDRIRARP